MSITDELREWARDNLTQSAALCITAIADRIDAEHEESIQREHESAYDAGYAEGMGVANKADMRAEYLRGKNDGYDEGWDAGFTSADDWLGQHEDAMAEHGWVRLPKDADGVPIHVGDVMEPNGANSLFGQASFEVRAMRYDEGGWEVYDRLGDRYAPSLLRHHHAPTVEEVLTEFGIDWEHESDCEDRAALLKEYASKLQLKEDE